ncbi:MAG: acetyl-CoA hydrolase/transferase family protein [Methylocystaceae bacterium]
MTWNQLYSEKIVTAVQAAGKVKSGDTLVYGSFLGRPIDFDQALAARKEEINDVNIYYSGGMTPMETAVVDPTHEHFTLNSWFFGAADRRLHEKDQLFYAPLHFSQLQDIIANDEFPIDMHVQQVSPMDEHGYFSFSLANVYSLESCLKARIVVLEVNENLPRVPGGSEDSIHISMVDYVIDGCTHPLFELPPAKAPTEVDLKMAQLLLEEIPDRACLQLGIGSLPNLLGELLCASDLRDLGIHTEMFTDSMKTMFETGKVTGRYKTTDRCKMALSFALGTKPMYEFMHNNPLMANHCGRWTNNPQVIAMNDRFISINNVVAVDLTSQVCSESSGPRQVSGTGGQMDFVTGAWYSKGGKSFLCLSSTYTDKYGKEHSRIVPTLAAGSVVTTVRTSVDYIVTEYGKARMKGKPTWKRAELLIELAHPDFRDELIRQAEDLRIWRRSNKIE